MRMRYTASNIPSLKNRTVFFDANSLIYIFWPTTPDSEKADDYGSILAALIKNNVNLAVNEIVLSEIINRILRIEFGKTGLNKDEFKNFRDSESGKSVQNDIYMIIKNRILSRFKVINEILSKEEIDSMLITSKLDFNDKLIEQLCKKKNMLLLTHDFDFSSSDVDILSANMKFRFSGQARK
ncbi:PIN domain-containing protein [uncultured Treponema sp.]|uniref:type II toxin-antitoxin system VapC family toxin n=1 Tax=uncultured Treponema sp. TaxID=162155 RepID=UPI002591AAC9|nr:PIN domain-containing protein [uncultured Treponema sp.]